MECPPDVDSSSPVLLSHLKHVCCFLSLQQSVLCAEVTPAGCCCGDAWRPSDSPRRGWHALWLPRARSSGSSGPPPAGRSTGAAWKTAAPPETHEGSHFTHCTKSHPHEATTYQPEEEKLLLAQKKEWIFKNWIQKKIFKSSWKASLTSPVANCRSSGAHWWIYRVLAEVLVFRHGLLPGQWGSVWASAGPDTRPRSSAGSGSVVAVARGARSSESLIRRRNRFLQLMN